MLFTIKKYFPLPFSLGDLHKLADKQSKHRSVANLHCLSDFKSFSTISKFSTVKMRIFIENF